MTRVHLQDVETSGSIGQYLKRTAGGAEWAAAPGGSEAFPVGAVFIGVVSTDPATLLGYGTWSAIAAGRVLVGRDAGDVDFDVAEETGGAKTVASAGTVAAPTLSGSTAAEAAHTHTYTQVPNHVHGLSTILRSATTGAATTQVARTSDTTSTADATLKTDNPDGGVAQGTTAAGSSHSHGTGTLAASAPAFTGSATSVVQPYFVVYMWKRTA
jgi:hypothetical protein